jgi:hypothetical protein
MPRLLANAAELVNAAVAKLHMGWLTVPPMGPLLPVVAAKTMESITAVPGLHMALRIITPPEVIRERFVPQATIMLWFRQEPAFPVRCPGESNNAMITSFPRSEWERTFRFPMHSFVQRRRHSSLFDWRFYVLLDQLCPHSSSPSRKHSLRTLPSFLPSFPNLLLSTLPLCSDNIPSTPREVPAVRPGATRR